MTGRKPSMVLPPHDVASGEVQGDWLGRDVRIPAPLRDRNEYAWEGRTPQVVASYIRPDECPDGRHLWDVIESVSEREVEQEDGEWKLEQTFRARLTCVRCGTVRAWEGVRDGDVKDPAGVCPVPLVAGDLLAQQVKAESSGWGTRDMSTWHVYRGRARVGAIDWAAGPRGRAYFVGRLDEWPDGESVEGKDAAAVLRRINRRAVPVAGESAPSMPVTAEARP